MNELVGMKVEERDREGVRIFDISGRICASPSLALKHLFDRYIGTCNEGEANLLLNFDQVKEIDSSGLGILVATYTSVQRKGGRVALLHVSGNILTQLVMAKLVTVIDRYEDEDRAIESFRLKEGSNDS